ncbi:hypothetical protein L9F63_009733, partial [Diploptera punctata]
MYGIIESPEFLVQFIYTLMGSFFIFLFYILTFRKISVTLNAQMTLFFVNSSFKFS